MDGLLHYGFAGLFLLLWLGLCVGSFLNVVIYRMPVMLERQFRQDAEAFLAGHDGNAGEATAEAEAPFNLLVPRSRCPGCQRQIRAWHNVPVLSWLYLRGRCAACGMRISPRYPLVEGVTALLTLAVIAQFGFTVAGGAALVFTWMLVGLTGIDYDTQYLPDQLTLPLLWLGLLVNLGGTFVALADAVVGAAAGYLLLWSVYWGFKLLTGKEGMGYGDFKLLGAIGAWLGWQILPGTILLAAASGLVFALIGFMTGGRQRAQPIPFGPFLAIGGWAALMARDTVLTLLAS